MHFLKIIQPVYTLLLLCFKKLFHARRTGGTGGLPPGMPYRLLLAFCTVNVIC